MITPTLRFEILKRDLYACVYCGRRAPDVELQVDHVIPKALSGPTVPENLVTSCEDCNRGKGARGDTKAIASVDLDHGRRLALAEKALEAAAELQYSHRALTDQLSERFFELWSSSHGSCYLPPTWRRTLAELQGLGLTERDLEWAFSDLQRVEDRVEKRWGFLRWRFQAILDQRREIAAGLLTRAPEEEVET